MAKLLTQKITRDKLAKIFSNQEAIKLIENLTADTASGIPEAIAAASDAASAAQASAYSAVSIAAAAQAAASSALAASPPPGGVTGQVLSKSSNASYAYAWATLPGGESSPVFTYASGVLSRIDYASGAYKIFTYTSGVLTQLDYVVGAITTRKVFNYTSGVLTSITQTVF